VIDYYTILGVQRRARLSVIKKAYRRLARKYHPDLNPGDRRAEERFKRIAEAYDVLCDSEKRKKHDRELENGPALAAGDPTWEADAGQDPGFDLGNLNSGFASFFAEVFGGRVCAEIRLCGITLRHQPARGCVTHEIAGHMHPAARISVHGYIIRRPCFVANGRRLVMPAFGAYVGGLNVLDDAFHPLFGDGGMAVWMLGQEGLFPVATRLLSQD